MRRRRKLRTVVLRGHRFHMAKSHLRVVAPTEVKRTVAPKRGKNAEFRTREHFTPDEVEALIEAAKGNRHGHRDATMILLTCMACGHYSRDAGAAPGRTYPCPQSPGLPRLPRMVGGAGR
jgi:hypothetical protein